MGCGVVVFGRRRACRVLVGRGVVWSLGAGAVVVRGGHGCFRAGRELALCVVVCGVTWVLV